MAIEVTCPGCKKQFKVSDQFAGKKGPCPQCKTVITIPQKSPEVVIHAPDTEGPKDSSGRPVLRPLSRKETKATPALIATIVGGIVLAIAGAIAVRVAFPAPTGAAPPSAARQVVLALSALLLGPPLVFSGYALLRDQELEPHRGRAMILRVALCAGLYALIWGLFAWIPPAINVDLELYVLAFIVPLMVAAGASAAFATLDLEFGTSAMHYGLYLVATVILCFIAGVQLFESAPQRRVPRPVPKRPTRASMATDALPPLPAPILSAAAAQG